MLDWPERIGGRHDGVTVTIDDPAALVAQISARIS